MWYLQLASFFCHFPCIFRIKSFLMDLEVESEFLYLVVLTIVNRLGSQVHVK
jgi:hypothetical protein